MHGRRWGRAAIAAGALIGAVAGLAIVQAGSAAARAAIGSHPNTIAAFDATTHELVGETQLGDEPGDVQSFAGAIWVMTAGGTLNRIDPQNLKATRPLAIGDGPWTVGYGAVWAIASDDPSALIRIDPNYLTKREIHLRTDTADTGWPPAVGIALGDDLVWMAGNGHVEGFDPATGKRVHSYSINGAWALRFADGALYVASSPTGYVRKVDAQTGRVLWRTQLQPWINNILVSGGSLWAVLGADATVHQLALNDGRDLATIPTGPPNSDPQTITAGDGALWVDNPRNGTVARIDPVDPRRRRRASRPATRPPAWSSRTARCSSGCSQGPATISRVLPATSFGSACARTGWTSPTRRWPGAGSCGSSSTRRWPSSTTIRTARAAPAEFWFLNWQRPCRSCRTGAALRGSPYARGTGSPRHRASRSPPRRCARRSSGRFRPRSRPRRHRGLST